MVDIQGFWSEIRRTVWYLMSWRRCLTLKKIPRRFMLISLLEVCQEGGGVKKESAWRTLRVPDRRLGWHDHFWHYEWCFYTPGNLFWKFQINIPIRREAIRDLGANGQPPQHQTKIRGNCISGLCFSFDVAEVLCRRGRLLNNNFLINCICFGEFGRGYNFYDHKRKELLMSRWSTIQSNVISRWFTVQRNVMG